MLDSTFGGRAGRPAVLSLLLLALAVPLGLGWAPAGPERPEIPAGETHELRFTADARGTYMYQGHISDTSPTAVERSAAPLKPPPPVFRRSVRPTPARPPTNESHTMNQPSRPTTGPRTPTGFRLLPLLLLPVLLAGCGAPPAADAAGSDATRVMVLGTYHFVNRGNHVVESEVADVLAPEKQREIAEVLEWLAEFRPTKIAVEVELADAPLLDSVYRAYRTGEHELSRSELQQIAFRLAGRLDHARLHPIDHDGDFPYGPVLEYANRHDPEAAEFLRRTTEESGERATRRQREMSVGEILRVMNDPASLAEDHSVYTRLATIGAGDGYAGAELVTRWYERNIHIFSNLDRIAEPGDRILVVMGAGHAPILRHLIAHTPGMELVDVGEYLPGG